METKTINRNLFKSKHESKSPIKLTNLSPSNTGIIFFNSNIGSRLHDTDDVSFKFIEETVIKINEIALDQRDGHFDVKGNIRWQADTRTVAVGERQVPRQVRDGLLADQTGTITISIWGQDLIDRIKENTTYKITKVVVQNNFGMKLTTTANTVCTEDSDKVNVNWENLNPQAINHIICCPEIMSAKVLKYLTCVNTDCKKKVTPFQAENTVTCKSPSCNRKMLVSRCKTSFSAEITLQEPSQRQHTVTIFPKTLETFYQKKGKVLNVDHLEDEMLEFQSFDFTVNRRKIVIKIEEHLDQECKGTGTEEVNNKTNNNIDQDQGSPKQNHADDKHNNIEDGKKGF